MPTYNRGHLIARALKSVISQTAEVHEIIVVDDGSEDDTADVLRAFIEAGHPLTVLTQDRRGAPAARNRGISAASGSLIAFQDSDDEWQPTFLEELLRLHDQPDLVAFSSLLTVRADGRRSISYPERIDDVPSRLVRENCISTQTALVSASLLAVHRFDESLPRLQDWDLWLGMIGSARFIHIPKPLATQHLQSDSITAGGKNLYVALRRITRKRWRVLMRRPPTFARWWIASRLHTMRVRRAAL